MWLSWAVADDGGALASGGSGQCVLCRKQTRPNDRLRPVRALHFHWARLMELDSERHWLSGVFEKGEVVAWWDGVCSAQGMSGAR